MAFAKWAGVDDDDDDDTGTDATGFLQNEQQLSQRPIWNTNPATDIQGRGYAPFLPPHGVPKPPPDEWEPFVPPQKPEKPENPEFMPGQNWSNYGYYLVFNKDGSLRTNENDDGFRPERPTSMGPPGDYTTDGQPSNEMRPAIYYPPKFNEKGEVLDPWEDREAYNRGSHEYNGQIALSRPEIKSKGRKRKSGGIFAPPPPPPSTMSRGRKKGGILDGGNIHPRPVAASGRSRGPNKWIEHVKKVHKQLGGSYSEALRKAAQTYHKSGSKSGGDRPVLMRLWDAISGGDKD